MPYEILSALKIVPNETVGAFAHGLDLRRLNEIEIGELKLALANHGVLFFRDQDLTPADHIAFAEHWGEASVHPFLAKVDGHPKVAIVSKEAHQKDNIGGGWHSDHTFEHHPALGSVLVARDLPKRGGDTRFLCMYKAYETLPEELKRELASLRAIHSAKHIFGGGMDSYFSGLDIKEEQVGHSDATANMEDPAHPMVITHPLSRRKALFINPGFTIRVQGRSYEESKPFLQMLYAHAMQDDHVYQLKWEPGSVAFWDNRTTWHWALNDYPGERRVMHRVTINGGAVE